MIERAIKALELLAQSQERIADCKEKENDQRQLQLALSEKQLQIIMKRDNVILPTAIAATTGDSALDRAAIRKELDALGVKYNVKLSTGRLNEILITTKASGTSQVPVVINAETEGGEPLTEENAGDQEEQNAQDEYNKEPELSNAELLQHLIKLRTEGVITSDSIKAAITKITGKEQKVSDIEPIHLKAIKAWADGVAAKVSAETADDEL